MGSIFDKGFLEVTREKIEKVTTRNPVCKTCNHDPVNRLTQELRAFNNGEVSKSELDLFKETLREEVAHDIDELSRKVETLSSSNTQHSNELTYHIVMRNIPETINENNIDKVNTIISKSLNIADVKVSKAVRKMSDSSSWPGVVIVTFHSATDKSKMMKVKANLRNVRQFGKEKNTRNN